MWKIETEKNKCQSTKFDNIDDAKKYVWKLFSFLNNQQEYNIFIHQIQPDIDVMDKIYGTEKIKRTLQDILSTGFKISKYGTLSGTAKLVCSTNNIDLDSIFGYDYYKGLDCKALCIVAIPKWAKVEGEVVEYSTFNGEDAWTFPKELTKEYEKTGQSKPELHHYKSSLFDAIKKYNELPNCYLLGVLKLEQKTNDFAFYNPKTHLAFMSAENQLKHDKLVENHVVGLYEKYQTTDVKKLIVAAYKETQAYYDYLNDFDV
ncbi:MAG: hypothetical protein IJA69_06295 [Clostridia bacterium]|nr:hypothetical protein [Clostridia bacterium]